MLTLIGLRVSEAADAIIEALGTGRKHRTTVITRKGGRTADRFPLERLTVPTLVISATDDPLAPYRYAAEAASPIPGALPGTPSLPWAS